MVARFIMPARFFAARITKPMLLSVMGLPGIAPGKSHGLDLLPEGTDEMAGWLGEYLGHTYRPGKAKEETKPKEEVPLAEEVK